MSSSGLFNPDPTPVGDTVIQDVQDPQDRIAAMRRDVTEAVLDGRLTIAFQPVTGADNGVAFHEALLRLVEPDGSLVPASNFLPLFQEPELGQVLDCTALKRSLQALKADLKLRLSVNVSAISFGCEEWMDLLEDAQRSVPDVCSRLLVEFPEPDALIDLDRTHAFMVQLSQKGVGLALDRFGADEAWFSRFRNFRFNLLKLDCRRFTEADRNSDLREQARLLLETARSFEMRTVAEFVETPETVQAAEGLGLDFLQGYLIGQPELRWRRDV